jgi:hypothetical protein
MSGNTIFQSLVGEEGRCGTNWPTEIVEKATLYEFEKIIDSSLPPVTHTVYGSHFRLFFTHFSLKRTQRIAFKKYA